MIISGTNDMMIVYIHCVCVSGTSLKISAIGLKMTTPICIKAPNRNAPTRYLFSKMPYFKDGFL